MSLQFDDFILAKMLKNHVKGKTRQSLLSHFNLTIFFCFLTNYLDLRFFANFLHYFFQANYIDYFKKRAELSEEVQSYWENSLSKKFAAPPKGQYPIISPEVAALK